MGSSEPGLLLYYGATVPVSAPTARNPSSPPDANPAARTLTGTSIYVIDKVTAGIAERGIQPGERFFAIGGTSVGDGLVNQLPGGSGVLPPGTVTRYAVSDGLNALGGLNTSQSLPDQFNNPANGTRAAAFTSSNAFRPETTFAQAGARGDTHLYVVAGDGTAARPNTAMRADLQVLADGRSSGAVSVGGIVPVNGAVNAPIALAGRTVGSTRLDTSRYSAAITSNLGSLATGADGVSAHLLGGPGLNGGQASYLAISQADPRLASTATNTTASADTPPAQVQPGSVQPITGTAGTDFAYTRLATNVGSTAQPAGAVTLQGYAAAMVERTGTGGNGIYAQSTTGPDGVTINRAANANTFSAQFKLQPTAAGYGAFDPNAARAPVDHAQGVTLAMGDPAQPGATPRSAYVSASTFAAIGDTHAMTSVDRDILAGLPDAARAVMPASNEHVAWGYFLGDLAQPTDAQRDHVNLGFWVAGRPVDATTLAQLTGSATYTGGMIGTAVAAGRLATATGQFTQSWNFGGRAGTLNATFDGRTWSGVNLAMPKGTSVFNGAGSSADGNLAVQGSFFHNGALSGTATPQAVGGHFAISAPTYGANGIMVGTRP